MGSSGRVVSRSERARAFGPRLGAGSLRRGVAGPRVEPGGRGADGDAGARRGRAAGAGWLFPGLQCAAPGPIAPSRVCATGAFPTRPTARSRATWPISFGTARAWTPSCSTAVRCTPRSCASGCSTRLRPGRTAPARSSWKTPNPILRSRAAPRASASCCTRHAGRIAAGAARAVFLAVADGAGGDDQAAAPALICVLPRNAAAEQAFEINLPGLELRTDQLVSFQACSSTRHDRCRAGDVLPWDADAFHALPPLETIIRTAHGADAGPDRTVPVRLAAKMNALGLLQISCVGTDPQTPQSWPLEFNLRPHEHGGAAARGRAGSRARRAERHDRGPAGRAGSHRDHIHPSAAEVRPADRQRRPEDPGTHDRPAPA